MFFMTNFFFLRLINNNNHKIKSKQKNQIFLIVLIEQVKQVNGFNQKQF